MDWYRKSILPDLYSMADNVERISLLKEAIDYVAETLNKEGKLTWEQAVREVWGYNTTMYYALMKYISYKTDNNENA